MARRMSILSFGAGLNTNQPRGQPGESSVSRNFQHNRGTNTARVRFGVLRVWNTRTFNATVLNIFEFVNSSGTVFRIDKNSGSLETFSLTAGTAKTSLLTGLSTAGPADIREAMHYLFVADQGAANYISDGTAGNTRALSGAAPTTALSPTETGAAAATGFGTGTYRVAYSFSNSAFGFPDGQEMETPPRAFESITKTSANTGIRVTIPAAPGLGFDRVNLYRTKAGETAPYYWVASTTTFGVAFDLTVLSTDIPSSVYYKSRLHNDDGEIVAVNIGAAAFCEWHKGFLHLGLFSGSGRLRHRWSALQQPTQFFVTTIAKSPAHYHDLEPGMGRVFTGMNSFNGSLVLFKDYSITVKNGDVDPTTWQWSVAVDGIGCIARWTRAVAPSIGIFFAGADGVYLFDLNSIRKLSDREDGSGIGNDYRALDFSTIERWWGMWNEQTREYWLTVIPTGTSQPRTYVYGYDSNGGAGSWATIEWGMDGLIASSAGIVTNASSAPRVYIGSSNGYAYETGRATQTDGPISGTVTGTATGSGSTTLTDSAAAFYTLGDGLTGLFLTVRHSASSYESRIMSSNTATQITVDSAWTTTPAVGARYFVGAIRGTLALSQWDGGDVGEKTFRRISGTWVDQSHTTPTRIGFTLDDDTVPTYGGDEEAPGYVRFGVGVNDSGFEIGAYFDIIGTSPALELKTVEIEYSRMSTRVPVA